MLQGKLWVSTCASVLTRTLPAPALWCVSVVCAVTAEFRWKTPSPKPTELHPEGTSLAAVTAA